MKTLKYINGNLLLSKEVEVIGHQANCQNTFGAGIARTIKELYPEAYHVDTMCAAKKRNVLGSFSAADIPISPTAPFVNKHGNRICRIYNLYGQNLGTDHSKKLNRKTDYEALYTALEGMADTLRATPEDKMMFDFNREPAVGFPYLMGCALGGGSWEVVERLIQVAFDGYEGDVIIHKFTP